MIQSESKFRNRLRQEPAEPQRSRPGRSIVGVFQGLGALVVGFLAGPKRAGRAAGIETILGASLTGAGAAVLVWLVHVGRAMNLLDGVEVGLGIGAGLGTALHLFTLAVEDHAKAKKRTRFGDN
jgi:hypothetical protein